MVKIVRCPIIYQKCRFIIEYEMIQSKTKAIIAMLDTSGIIQLYSITKNEG